MTDTEAKLYLKEPNEVKTNGKGGAIIEDHVYDRITLTYRNGVLMDWIETEGYSSGSASGGFKSLPGSP